MPTNCSVPRRPTGRVGITATLFTRGTPVPGLLALRNNDVATCPRAAPLEAGKTPSFTSNRTTFGPNMTLASELLKAGDSDTVLAYLDLCRKFWKLGGARLDSMSKTIRDGRTPVFDLNMPQ